MGINSRGYTKLTPHFLEYKFLFTTKYYLENEFIRNYLFEVNKKNINIEFLIRRTYYVTIVLLKKANFISNIYKNTTLK